MTCDILITGTGMFAGRIALDLAATARDPVRVVIAGRNRTRLDWLRTAGNARAAMFGTPARFATQPIDLLEPEASEALIRAHRPRLVVQAASIQTSTVISDGGSRWTDLVAEGGLSATAVFQALISGRMAAAISALSPRTRLINCSFPDVVNGMITEMGHQVLCGTGNVAILSNVFEGARDGLPDGRLRVLAQYQCLAPWRLAPEARTGAFAPRVFVGDRELDDPFATFRQCRLTPEPAIEISGASGVTLMLALIAGRPWQGHVPGPNGLAGGYPVRLQGDRLALDLPAGVAEAEAIAWNDAFERRNGLTVSQGRACYHGRLRALLEEAGWPHAGGFDLAALEPVCQDMAMLRDRLMAQPSARPAA
ncbi:hypothetical protein SAMN05421774_101425 [Gemmobacter megaterium]|uniref:Saccharopine dehydrogenase NADP binding domain-containing protein n=1 Tax=Gemmobacter megaterium TaxID=1086013 RepID=A0A1N7KH60_9RHOB|nr:hypothetical protein [Gemmobacter megaterium]GGE02103.1 hypothetical protein GCM10011345_04180 [Gemmobacter megaterium]SIS60824.1 hypothetical protein SAMN05421774_101425 [Gemmobacter megaterium]